MADVRTDISPFVPEVVEPDAGLSPAPASRTFWADAWRRFLANKAALISLIVLLTAAVMSTFAPLFTHWDPMAYNLHPSQWYQAPSGAHWFGTDSLGRDMYARVLYGTRGPLGTAIAGSILCTVLGAVLGVVAGLYGGWIDSILNRITELIWVVPGFILLILFIALYGRALDGILGPAGRYVMVTIFLATDGWPLIMRIARAETLRLRESPFIEATEVVGGTRAGMIRRHFLPNMLGILFVQGALLVPGFIFTTSALGFLGLINPLVPDLGLLINQSATFLQMDATPTLVTVSVITVLILAATFLGDGLRDAFDVRTN
ncbi:MAG TPA: ABC transporter permease [Chloroflexota bacterium]|nr:ABC transporter permease [Chloroflexota bacterium]